MLATAEVFVATPIHIARHPGDIEFNALARQFWLPYGSITCGRAKPASPEHRCSVTGNLLDNQFSGEARFIEGENRIIPVICFATRLPDEKADFSRAYTPQARAAMVNRAIANLEHRSMAAYSYKLCGPVLDSIQLKEESVSPSIRRPRTVAAQASLPTLDGAREDQSLGELARVTREQAVLGAKAKLSVEAEDTLSRAPAGFRIRSNMRCTTNCWQERFFLPENARRVTGGNSDNVYVAMLDATTSVIIYFGTTEVTNGYGEYGTAHELALRWIHGQRDNSSKDIRTSRTINGRRVSIMRTRLLANLTAWTEEDAKVGTDGVNFSIGCIARENRFADAESVCSTIYESWQLRRE